jgi:hypothetical protein
MVKRVHPETGRGRDRWQDRVTTQRALREEERALGLREVRGRLHQLDGQPMADRTRVTSGEYRETARSDVPGFLGGIGPSVTRFIGAS